MNSKNYTFYQSVGRRIRSIRVEKGITQTQLADKAGLSVPSINDIENARTNMWLISFVKICEALDTSPDDILMLDTASKATCYEDEILSLFSNCTPMEKAAILDAAMLMKKSLFDEKAQFQ